MIEDFCSKAGITLKNKAQKLTNIKSNKKFDNIIVEAVNIAMELGLDVPTSHKDNIFFAKNLLIKKHDDPINNSFILTLKQYIDSYYLESNMKLCDNYNLEKSYFSVEKNLSKDEILNNVKNEQSIRKDSDEMIVRYKNLIGVMAE